MLGAAGLLWVWGVTGNVIGALFGILASPLLLIGFLVTSEQRSNKGKFGDWRFLPSQPTTFVMAIVGWVVGVAHLWFLAQEITRWQAG